MYTLFCTIIIFFILYSVFNKCKESFNGIPIFGFASRINRPTRNMSYDLRGEEYYPPLLNLPFDNSSISPNISPILIDNH